MKHVLYKTGDADAPPSILDRNGEVTLGLCRVCGQGEAELAPVCPAAIDTVNKFMVSGTIGEEATVLILRPPNRSLTREEALVFAAWIVVMTHPRQYEFKRILEAVENV
jgi:hypothetical protein